MNINFKNAVNFNIFNVNKISKMHTQITFKGKGTGVDTFERRTEQLAPIRKEKIAKLKATLEEKKAKLAEHTDTYGEDFSVSLSSDRLSKRKYAKISSEMATLKSEISRIEEELARLVYEDKYFENSNIAFLYNPDLTNRDKNVLLKEKPFIRKVDNIGRELLGNSRYGKYWAATGRIQAEQIPKGLYVDTTLPKNNSFLESVKSTKNNMISYSDILEKYNMSKDKLDEIIKSGGFTLVYGDIDNIGKYVKKGSWYFSTESDEAKQIIEDHVKITPQKSEYCQDKTKKSTEVPIDVLSDLGFGNHNKLIKLINSGKIKGRYVTTEEDGKEKRKVVVDINDANTETRLKSLRNRSDNIYEIGKLSEKTGLQVSEIEHRILQDEGKIIKHFIFSDDADKRFLDLSDEKNAEFAELIRKNESLES